MCGAYCQVYRTRAGFVYMGYVESPQWLEHRKVGKQNGKYRHSPSISDVLGTTNIIASQLN